MGKDLRETKRYVRYEVFDQNGKNIDDPAILFWTMFTTLNTTAVKKLSRVVEQITDSEQELIETFDRYREIVVTHFFESSRETEVYQFSTTRYGEKHILTVWIKTDVPDFDYQHIPSSWFSFHKNSFE